MASKVSVIIPANDTKDSSEAIRSCGWQAYPDYEIIAVARNSWVAESAMQICICPMFPPGRLFVEEYFWDRTGDAYREGADHSTGDILVFMDEAAQISVCALDDVVQSVELGFIAGSMQVYPREGSLAGNAASWLLNRLEGIPNDPFRWIARHVYDELGGYSSGLMRGARELGPTRFIRSAICWSSMDYARKFDFKRDLVHVFGNLKQKYR